MQQGRRTASLKASYEAVSKSVELTKELALGREYGNVSSRSAQAASTADHVSTTKSSSSRHKKWVVSDVIYTYTQPTVSKHRRQNGTMMLPCALGLLLGGRLNCIIPVNNCHTWGPRDESLVVTLLFLRAGEKRNQFCFVWIYFIAWQKLVNFLHTLRKVYATILCI